MRERAQSGSRRTYRRPWLHIWAGFYENALLLRALASLIYNWNYYMKDWPGDPRPKPRLPPRLRICGCGAGAR
jgi:hypothetical protein